MNGEKLVIKAPKKKLNGKNIIIKKRIL